jgi:serine/threonine-protein kinase 19
VFFFFFLVQSLRREKIVRIFKLNTGQDDHAVMFLDDYLNQVGCI